VSTEYIEAQKTYAKLADAARSGNAQAREDKIKAMNEIRAIERQSAREGRVLSANVRKNGKGDYDVKVSVADAPTKRSLQEEYIRKFKPPIGEKEVVVKINGQETTLAAHHSKRLLGK
jgi:hypothetical protein